MHPTDPTGGIISIDDELSNVTGDEPETFELQLGLHEHNGKAMSKSVDVEQLKAWAFDVMLQFGHGVVTCAPIGDATAPYAYTVGRTLKGRPELLVTGVEGDGARHLLNDLVAYDDLLNVAEAGDVMHASHDRFKLIDGNPRYCSAAILSFGKIRVLQALRADAAGHYPDSLEGRTSSQPVLPAIRETWDPYP